MRPEMLLPLGVFGLLLSLGAGALLLLGRGQQGRLEARLRLARGEAAAPVPVRQQRLLGVIGTLGAQIARSGALSARTMRELQQTLSSAGIQASHALELFIAAKILAAIVLPVLALLVVRTLPGPFIVHLVVVLAAFVAGMLSPDFIIRRRRGAYVQRVEAGLGDALDMMVICAEAGLGLEPALLRVSKELRPVHPDLSDELHRTVQELQVLSESRIALQNMGTRTGIAGLRRLSVTMIQSMQFGTPLIQALRTLAAELRGEMLLRFEERAARLPTLLTVPMILFILPTVFLVVGGPAVIQVAHNFFHH